MLYFYFYNIRLFHIRMQRINDANKANIIALIYVSLKAITCLILSKNL